ncbi:MAG: hypothetical protein OEL89_00775 [Candidatus Peregrinibacteria bacterium]|nr:hypothetical protein [Candidatus Peregrinibacteria bacterium]
MKNELVEIFECIGIIWIAVIGIVSFAIGVAFFNDILGLIYLDITVDKIIFIYIIALEVLIVFTIFIIIFELLCLRN